MWKLKELGHEPRIIPAQFVKPYVKSNKNDMADAEAIVEAMSRPNMRFVSLKSKEQQDILGLHRIREARVGDRTRFVNETRALLYERGIRVPKGVNNFKKRALLEIDSSEELSSVMRATLRNSYFRVIDLDAQICKIDQQIDVFYNSNEDCKRLGSIPGVGVLTATAIVGMIGDARCFKNGRELSAYLGLVPRHYGSGGKQRLGRISKRGDTYLRKLLIHGGRSVVLHCGKKKDKRSLWVQKKLKDRGYAKTYVAVANKNARIAWALLVNKEEYKLAS